MSIDWAVIREQYESGRASLSSLEREHGVSRQAIKKHVLKEGWVTPRLQVTVTHVTVPPVPVKLPIPADAVAIARAGLKQLAKHFEDNACIDIRDHKSLSDALAQYVKVIVTAPPKEEEDEEGLFIPYREVSPETLQAIRRLLLEDQRLKERVG